MTEARRSRDSDGPRGHSYAPTGLGFPMAIMLGALVVIATTVLPSLWLVGDRIELFEILVPGLQQTLRNSTAAALSLALVAAAVGAACLSRPLARLAQVFEGPRDDELPPTAPKHAVASVRRLYEAFSAYAKEYRYRVVLAKAGRSMLEQFVESLSLPVALFDPDGHLATLNGPLRALLHADERAKAVPTNGFPRDEVVAAVRRSESRGEPVKAAFAIGNELRLEGWVQALRQPDATSAAVFVAGSTSIQRPASPLPKPHTVTTCTLQALCTQSQARVQARESQVKVAAVQWDLGEVADRIVADSENRCSWALAMVLEAALQGGVALPITAEGLDTTLRLVVPGRVPASVRATSHALIQALGGRVTNDSGKTLVFLPCG